MPLRQVWALLRYWEEQPPTYQAVGIIARMLGWKPPESETQRQRNAEEFRRAMKRQIPQRLALGGMPAPVLDLDTFREQHRKRAVEGALRKAGQTG
jgi:hypothetical protein